MHTLAVMDCDIYRFREPYCYFFPLRPAWSLVTRWLLGQS